MIRIAGVFAVLALAGLIGVSIWATGIVSIVPAINDLVANPSAGYTPWFIATLFDAYFAFLWFWLWIAYKERNWAARIVWLVLILGLGNIAMAAYMLIQIARLPSGAPFEALLLRRP